MGSIVIKELCEPRSKMATGGVPDISELKTNFLSCSLCLEQYQEPCTLDCNHTFCLLCLENYVDKNNLTAGKELACPLCREKTITPNDGLSELRPNFHLKGLTEFINAQTDKSEVTEAVFEEKSDIQCQVHNRHCEIFCKDDKCELPLCVNCVSKHTGHVLVDLEDHIESMRMTMKNRKDEKEVICKQILNKLEKIYTGIQGIEKFEKSLHEKVEEQLQCITKITTAKAASVKSEISANLAEKKSECQTYQDKLLEDSEDAHNTIKEIEAILSMVSVKHILSAIGKIKCSTGKACTSPEPDTSIKVFFNKPKINKNQLEAIVGSVTTEEDTAGTSCSEEIVKPSFNSQKQQIPSGRDEGPRIILQNTELFSCFGIQCIGDKEKPDVSAMCFGPDDTLVVADRENRCIKMFDMDGNLKKPLRFKFPNDPLGIVWSPHRNKYFVAVAYEGIYSVSLTGWVHKDRELHDKVYCPIDISVLPDGTLVVLEKAIFDDDDDDDDDDEEEQEEEEGKEEETVIALIRQNEDNYKIRRVSEDSQYVITYGDVVIVSGLNTTTAYSTQKGKKFWQVSDCMTRCMCPDYFGNIIVGDWDSKKVKILDVDTGKVKGHCTFLKTLPRALAMSQSNHLAAWNQDRRVIQIWPYSLK